MKKLLLLLFFTLILLPLCTGCTTIHKSYPIHIDSITASPNNVFNLICIDGVEYLLVYKILTPHFRADEEGRPYLIKCENK